MSIRCAGTLRYGRRLRLQCRRVHRALALEHGARRGGWRRREFAAESLGFICEAGVPAKFTRHAMPRSSGKGKKAGKKGSSSKEPKAKKAAVLIKPLDLEALQAANDLCLKLINGAVVLVGVALGAVAMSASSSGGGASAWTLGLYIAAAGLFVSGLLGQYVAHTGFKEIDVVTKTYFVLMVCLTMLMLWLSLFMTFNINEVKWLVKGWIYMNWTEFWESLPEGDRAMLRETGVSTQAISATS